MQDIGEKGKQYMKKQIHYQNEPFEARIVTDFLPKPEDLVLKQKRVKITLSLSKISIDFFKQIAKRHGASYQAMIRTLLDRYASQLQS